MVMPWPWALAARSAALCHAYKRHRDLQEHASRAAGSRVDCVRLSANLLVRQERCRLETLAEIVALPHAVSGELDAAEGSRPRQPLLSRRLLGRTPDLLKRLLSDTEIQAAVHSRGDEIDERVIRLGVMAPRKLSAHDVSSVAASISPHILQVLAVNCFRGDGSIQRAATLRQRTGVPDHREVPGRAGETPTGWRRPAESRQATGSSTVNAVGQRGLPVALVGAGLSPPLPRLLRHAKPLRRADVPLP